MPVALRPPVVELPTATTRPSPAGTWLHDRRHLEESSISEGAAGAEGPAALVEAAAVEDSSCPATKGKHFIFNLENE